ncbi:MAG: HD domain-containing protein [Salinibacter sp.]
MDWLQVTWSHHGRTVDIEQPDKHLWPDDSPQRLSRFLEWAEEWYPDAFDEAPSLNAPKAQHLFNGALTLADWIGSDTTLFEMDPTRTDPETEIDEARELALDAIHDVGLTVSCDLDSSLTTLLDGYEPYDIQEAVQSLPASSEGTLTVLESATGSGKTEGALGRYAHLLAKKRVDSMYFAVPTRAAAKELHGRIETARDRMFGEDGPPVHLAVPGYLSGSKEKH